MIIRLKFLFIAGLSLLFLPAYPQYSPGKTGSDLIIDTDCGIDDFRALSLLLYYSPYSIKCISVSDGNVDPENGSGKVCNLLKNDGKDAVPIGVGKTVNSFYPEWRDFNMSVSWGTQPDCTDRFCSSLELLSKTIAECNGKVTILALGPLTNIAELIENFPAVVKRIDRIVWYNETHAYEGGFNFMYNTHSAKIVLNSGIRIDIISSCGTSGGEFDLSSLTGSSDDPYDLLRLYSEFYTLNSIPEERFYNQSVLRDELAAIYLTNPELFNINTVRGNRMIRANTDYNLTALKEVLFEMVNGLYSHESHIVFSRFPSSRDMFTYDVRQIMDHTIQAHGMEEWKACVLTNELHGHLGIYSILGAKMGILACELLDAGKGEIQIVSHAGNIPPYSCLNDGLQVSTGSTLGMNLISVTGDTEPEILAKFTSGDKTVTLRLKHEYLEKVESDITEGIVKYGLLDDGYWKLVRHSALTYWKEWGRKEIFEMVE